MLKLTVKVKCGSNLSPAGQPRLKFESRAQSQMAGTQSQMAQAQSQIQSQKSSQSQKSKVKVKIKSNPFGRMMVRSNLMGGGSQFTVTLTVKLTFPVSQR